MYLVDKANDAAVEAVKKTPYVFVYGTLMEAYGNHIFLRDSPMICKATTVDSYEMLAAGIPYVNKDSPESKIKGEVYKVTPEVLEYDIDRLEGHPYSYCREVVKVKGDDGNYYDAWIYFYPTERLSQRLGLTIIKSGNYHDYRKNQTSWNG